MAKPPHVSDLEIIEAFEQLQEEHGKPPSFYRVQKVTGAYYGRIERIIGDYLRKGSKNAFLATQEKEQKALENWLLELVQPVAQALMEKKDKDVERVQEKYAQKLQAKEAEAQDLKEESKRLTNLAVQLQNQMAEMKEANESLTEQNEALQRKGTELEKLLIEADATKRQLNDELAELKKSLKLNQENLERFRDEYKVLLNNLNREHNAAITAQAARIEELKKEAQAERETRRVADQQLAVLAEQLKHSERALRNSESQSRDQHQRLESQQATLAEMQMSYSALEAKLVEAETREQTLARTLQELEAKNQSVEEQNRQLQQNLAAAAATPTQPLAETLQREFEALRELVAQQRQTPQA